MSTPVPPSPSKWMLDRFATGELPSDESAAIAAQLDERARAHLDAVDAVRAELPPVDVDALRARASRLPDQEPFDAYRPSSAADQAVMDVAPANRVRGWVRLVGVALVAALALFVLMPWSTPDTPPAFQTRTGALNLYVAQDGALHRYVSGSEVGQGDRIGFEVQATSHEGVVILSVDGTDAVSVFFPESGDAPLALSGDGAQPIEGTVTLDDAPGPEVFVAVFDTPVPQVVEQVTEVYEHGGHDAVLEWADARPDAAAVEITRR